MCASYKVDYKERGKDLPPSSLNELTRTNEGGMVMSLEGKDIISAGQFSREQVEAIIDLAADFEERVRNRETPPLLKGYLLASLFFEPSTRTRLSFEAAMARLGGQIISMADAKTSSAAKGETLRDSIAVISGYADVLVVRHPQKGAAQEAADAAEVPVINAGDGTGEHPTQALLDVYTIRKERGQVSGLTCCLLGDLKHGRTVHSLARLLALYGGRLLLVAPPELAMPADLVAEVRSRGLEVEEIADLREAVRQADVLYVTRVQKERFADPTEYERLRGSYVVDEQVVKAAKPGLTIMHPLPRVDEISPAVDAYPGAAYFRQAHNGVFVRMALLAMVLGKA